MLCRYGCTQTYRLICDRRAKSDRSRSPAELGARGTTGFSPSPHALVDDVKHLAFFVVVYSDVSHLAWPAADVRCKEGCSASSAWLDDQYISGHLNKEGVPMYLLPFPTHDSWRFLSHGSAARSSKNRTHLWLQTAWMLMRFAGTGEEAWSLPRAHLCTSDCAKTSRNKVPKHCAGANE